jgi:alpha-L-fucosidase 2
MIRNSIVILCILFTTNFNLFSQADKELGLHSEGGPWKFYSSSQQNESLPRVLLIGDSVMNGFHSSLIQSLEGIAIVDYWLTPKHLKSEHLLTDLQKVVSSHDYKIIQFNIGLHGWPTGRILEHEYTPLLESYVRTIQENARNSKLIWASTTPITEKGITALNKEFNPVISHRNDLALEIMKANQILVNDLYGLVKNKLDLAKLDKYHWKSGGYKLMADQSAAFITKELKKSVEIPTLSDYNVVWNSPSKNSLGSMPSGNGDIGVNLWVEENGDLVFYLSKTDAWSGNARLLKIGKVRLSLTPNPFKSGKPFLQELKVEDGLIHIEAGESKGKVAIDIWVDANHPVAELDVKSEVPLAASIKTEPWRTEKRLLDDKVEIHSAYGLTGDGAPEVFVEKDIILANREDDIVWLHDNKNSIWKENLELQELGKYTKKNQDPLLNRTFGGLIRAKNFKKFASGEMVTTKPLNEFSVSVYVLTTTNRSEQEWEDQITKSAISIELQTRANRLDAHKDWWHSFWDRSFIHVSSKNTRERVSKVSSNYALQRYMNACSGRGNSPIKFNGSIFTVGTKNLDNRFAGFDADYRQWGGPYWWQNTRLPYWSMLEAGDFDLMKPLFKMYKDALPIRKLATKTYYKHEGAFFPETMYFWGAFAGSNYGWDRSELPTGMTLNRFIRYYWQSGLEISLMMLDYYEFTKDEVFLKETLLPVVSEIINFYDNHWDRDESGNILFDPAMALETYNTAVNPLPEIVGINKVCSELLRLPVSEISKYQNKQWNRLIDELPEIPTKMLEGKKVLSPAQEYSGKQNIENPELYAIFPYRAFGVNKPELDMARFTFENRLVKQTGGWQQNAIKSALLGLTEEAAYLTSQNFNASTTFYRFPTMWGPNYDWTPDQCHGTVAMTALQRMLIQYDGDQILLLAAWPKEWDTKFKLNAPQKTIIEGEVRNGKLENLRVTPSSRLKNVVNFWKE